MLGRTGILGRGFPLRDFVFRMLGVSLAKPLLPVMREHDALLHFRAGPILERSETPCHCSFHLEEVVIFPVQKLYDIGLYSPWFLLGEGSELGEPLESSLVKKSCGFPAE